MPALFAGSACTVLFWMAPPSLAQAWGGPGGPGRPGSGGATGGPGRMGVMMASMSQGNSQHPELRALQQAMVEAQSREIEQMTQWYRRWYGTP